MPLGLLPSLGLFSGGVILLLLGGNLLVKGAVALAERLGVPPLTIGLTLVAFGTSAPELALNVAAALNGATALTFGNMTGSSLTNIGRCCSSSTLPSWAGSSPWGSPLHRRGLHLWLVPADP